MPPPPVDCNFQCQIQLEAVEQDRHLCAQFLDREHQDFKDTEVKIEEFCNWLSAQNLPQPATPGTEQPSAGAPAAMQRPRTSSGGALPNFRLPAGQKQSAPVSKVFTNANGQRQG